MDDYTLFVRNVFRKTGINLADYKEGQMKRRLTSFRDREGFASFHKMFQAFDKDTSLYERFLNRITINVSEFFRNPERWECLEREILPTLAKTHSHLTCWSAACSTGEEPYTLAILLTELRYSFDLWATDIDRSALERAQTGQYNGQAVKHVPSLLKKRHLMPSGDDRFTVVPQLKERVRFARHDLLRDPIPENRHHLIVCRNVMIYFTDDAKQRLYRALAKSLVPDGVLFVGSTEQILQPEKYGLRPLVPFFYQRKG